MDIWIYTSTSLARLSGLRALSHHVGSLPKKEQTFVVNGKQCNNTVQTYARSAGTTKAFRRLWAQQHNKNINNRKKKRTIWTIRCVELWRTMKCFVWLSDHLTYYNNLYFLLQILYQRILVLKNWKIMMHWSNKYIIRGNI